MALVSTLRPSDKVNFGLFKYASLYILAAIVPYKWLYALFVFLTTAIDDRRDDFQSD